MSRRPLQPPPTPTLHLDRLCCERTIALTLPTTSSPSHPYAYPPFGGSGMGVSSKNHSSNRSINYPTPSSSSKIRSAKGGSFKGSSKHNQAPTFPPPTPPQPAVLFVHVQVLFGVLPPLPEELQLINEMQFRGSLYRKRKTHRLLANKPDRPALRLCPLHRLHSMQPGLTLHIYDVKSGVNKIITLQGTTLQRLVMGITSPLPPSPAALPSSHATTYASVPVADMGLPAVGRYLLDACEAGLLHVVRMPYGAGMVGMKRGLNNKNNNNVNNNNGNIDNHPKTTTTTTTTTKTTTFAPDPSVNPSLPLPEVNTGAAVGAGGASRPVSGAKGVGFSPSTRGGDVDPSLPASGLAQDAEQLKQPTSLGVKEEKGGREREVTKQPSSTQLVAAVSFEFKLPRPFPLEWRIVETIPLLSNNNDKEVDGGDEDGGEENDPILTPRTPLPKPQVTSIAGIHSPIALIFPFFFCCLSH